MSINFYLKNFTSKTHFENKLKKKKFDFFSFLAQNLTARQALKMFKSMDKENNG